MKGECTVCQAAVGAIPHGSYEGWDEDLGLPLRFTLGKCPQCHGPMLFEQTDYGGGWTDLRQLFPGTRAQIGTAVPKRIRDAFNEAHNCYRAKAFTASAIMCRKTLEGVCVDHGVNAGTLAASLRMLHETGVIEGRLYDWADTLRLFGNEAAHDVDVQIAAQDATDTLDFTGAVLEYVYTFRDQFEKFKSRRKASDSRDS